MYRLVNMWRNQLSRPALSHPVVCAVWGDSCAQAHVLDGLKSAGKRREGSLKQLGNRRKQTALNVSHIPTELSESWLSRTLKFFVCCLFLVCCIIVCKTSRPQQPQKWAASQVEGGWNVFSVLSVATVGYSYTLSPHFDVIFLFWSFQFTFFFTATCLFIFSFLFHLAAHFPFLGFAKDFFSASVQMDLEERHEMLIGDEKKTTRAPPAPKGALRWRWKGKVLSSTGIA